MRDVRPLQTKNLTTAHPGLNRQNDQRAAAFNLTLVTGVEDALFF